MQKTRKDRRSHRLSGWGFCGELEMQKKTASSRTSIVCQTSWLLWRIPLGNTVDHVPHHSIECIVHLVVRFGASIREGRPAHSGRGSHHDGRGTWKPAIMPKVARTHHPAPGILSRGGGGKDGAGRRHDLDGFRFQNARNR